MLLAGSMSAAGSRHHHVLLLRRRRLLIGLLALHRLVLLLLLSEWLDIVVVVAVVAVRGRLQCHQSGLLLLLLVLAEHARVGRQVLLGLRLADDVGAGVDCKGIALVA